MLSRIDLITSLTAIALHLGIGYGLSRFKVIEKPASSVVEVDVRKVPPPEPPKLTPPEPPKAPEPEPPRKVVMKQKLAPPPTVTPPPNATPPKEPPREPPKPVFGVTMDSTTTGESSFSVPIGNTTMIDPKKSAKNEGPLQPLPAAPVQAARPVFAPVSEVYIKKMPEIDPDGCARAVKYPSEAEQLGIEGKVRLRVSLKADGSVHAVKLLEGLGHGLDEAAIYALKHSRECKFSPAVGTDGKNADFDLTYTFNFEINR